MPKTYKQSAVNAVILVLVLILFIYLGAQFSKNFSTMVSTQRTQEITDVDYLYLKGYVFRDESPMYRPGEGVCDYLLEDGAKVGVDQTYAVYYKTANWVEKQDELDELSEQIRRLSSKNASGGTVADLSAINSNLSAAYYSYINNVQNGNIAEADRRGEELVDAIVSYRSVTTGWNDIESGLLTSLQNDKSSLISSLGYGEKQVAKEGFYFYRTTDGYENLFSPEKLEGISCEELEKLVSSKAEVYSGGTIGKRIDSPKWFLVIPTDKDTVMSFSCEIVREAETETDTSTESGEERPSVPQEPDVEIAYHIGKTYSVTYSSDGEKSVNMVLDKAYVDENGKGYLVFYSYDLTLSAELSRAQDVKIKMGSNTGYRIPTEAIVEVDGEKGVYILVGTVVKFKRVTVIKEGDGYCIVNTYEMDRAEIEKLESESGEETAERPPYLYVNDLIITSGNDLYDGKLID